MPIPPPRVDRIGDLFVVRDDLLPGGTKRRFLTPLMTERWPETEFVFGGPAEGYAQVALGHSANDTGKHATFFIAERARAHPLTVEGRRLGVSYHYVRPGYLTVVQARAKAYAAEVGAKFLPLGFALPEVLDEAVEQIRQVDVQPREVWCVAGAGLLARALQRAFPSATHHAVQIGMTPNAGTAVLHRAPERFAQPAKFPPPFPSCAHYDAKAWRFLASLARPGALFWNVGA